MLETRRRPSLGLLQLRRHKYAEHFTYDRRGDHPAALSGPHVDVSIDSDGFMWPAEATEAGACFLELTVRATNVGGVVDPSIVASSRRAEVRQYLERESIGRRYVNLSGLGATANERIHLQGRHVSIGDQSARLFFFESVPVAEPLLVLAPHPDDAEIAAFGLFADRDAWVATATVGEVGTHDFGGLFPDDAPGALLRAKTRVWESISAPGYGGVPVTQAFNLGYFDGSLERMRRGEEGRSSKIDGVSINDLRALNPVELPPRDAVVWSAVVADMRWLIERINPRTIVCPHPVLDLHPDHRALGQAALEACIEAKRIDGQFFFYAVHPPGAGTVNVHPVGPRDGVVSLPPTSVDGMFHSIHHQALDEERVRRKILALDTYRDIREPDMPPKDLRHVVYDAVRRVYRHLVVYDTSFVRKAARPNELFFTAPVSEASALRARFSAERTRDR